MEKDVKEIIEIIIKTKEKKDNIEKEFEVLKKYIETLREEKSKLKTEIEKLKLIRKETKKKGRSLLLELEEEEKENKKEEKQKKEEKWLKAKQLGKEVQVLNKKILEKEDIEKNISKSLLILTDNRDIQVKYNEENQKEEIIETPKENQDRKESIIKEPEEEERININYEDLPEEFLDKETKKDRYEQAWYKQYCDNVAEKYKKEKRKEVYTTIKTIIKSGWNNIKEELLKGKKSTIEQQDIRGEYLNILDRIYEQESSTEKLNKVYIAMKNSIKEHLNKVKNIFKRNKKPYIEQENKEENPIHKVKNKGKINEIKITNPNIEEKAKKALQKKQQNTTNLYTKKEVRD